MTKKREAKKQCFVVGPIGKADGADRIHSDWLLEAIIQPVFASHPEFEVKRADKISTAGMINTQIIENLLDAEIVIADITTLNPNCFYEIGIRHMVQKPIIHMHLAGQSIPFDIAPFRSIEFSLDRPRDLEVAKIELSKFISEVLDPDYKVDNPVTVARGRVEFEKSATPAERALSEQVELLQERIIRMENYNVTKKQNPSTSDATFRHGSILYNIDVKNSNRRFLQIVFELDEDAPEGGFEELVFDLINMHLSNARLVKILPHTAYISAPATDRNRAGLSALERDAKMRFPMLTLKLEGASNGDLF